MLVKSIQSLAESVKELAAAIQSQSSTLKEPINNSTHPSSVSTATPDVTLDEIRRAMRGLEKPVALEILRSFDAKRLSDLKPDDYPLVIERLEELS